MRSSSRKQDLSRSICPNPRLPLVRSEVVLAHLSVTDTGCGISPEFLENGISPHSHKRTSLQRASALVSALFNDLLLPLVGHVEVNSEAGHVLR